MYKSLLHVTLVENLCVRVIKHSARRHRTAQGGDCPKSHPVASVSVSGLRMKCPEFPPAQLRLETVPAVSANATTVETPCTSSLDPTLRPGLDQKEWQVTQKRHAWLRGKASSAHWQQTVEQKKKTFAINLHLNTLRLKQSVPLPLCPTLHCKWGLGYPLVSCELPKQRGMAKREN